MIKTLLGQQNISCLDNLKIETKVFKGQLKFNCSNDSRYLSVLPFYVLETVDRKWHLLMSFCPIHMAWVQWLPLWLIHKILMTLSSWHWHVRWFVVTWVDMQVFTVATPVSPRTKTIEVTLSMIEWSLIYCYTPPPFKEAGGILLFILCALVLLSADQTLSNQ